MNIGSSEIITPNVVVPKKKRCKFFTSVFWDGVSTKLVETFISVKVWGLISVTTISTWLLLHKYIQGGDWTTVNTCVYATIYGVREVYKISKVNSENYSDDNI